MIESIEICDRHAVLNMDSNDKQLLAIKILKENKYVSPSAAYDEITRHMDWDDVYEFWWGFKGASRCTASFEDRLKEVNEMGIDIDMTLERYAIMMRYLRHKRQRSDSLSD